MNPTSRVPRWAQWAIRTAFCLVLIAIGLIVANVGDYAPYGLALRRATKLTNTELESLAGACTRHEQGGHQRFFGHDIPVEFRRLKPVSVSIYPDCSDITLLEKGDVRYIFIRVSTSAVNQEIDLVSYNGTAQESRRLWEKHPELTRRLNPAGRVVTVTQSNMSSSRDWIVLKDRLLVVDRQMTAGGSDQIAAELPLKAEDTRVIENSIANLPDKTRGHAFDAGVMDGVGLRVSFASDGSPNQNTDIVLANTWRGELGELIEAISQPAGNEYAIPFRGIIERMGITQGRPPPISLPLREYDQRSWGTILPWWCWWPRL